LLLQPIERERAAWIYGRKEGREEISEILTVSSLDDFHQIPVPTLEYKKSTRILVKCIQVFPIRIRISWVGGFGSGLGIRICIQAGQNCRTKKEKMKKFRVEKP
jgi:hypothetical protein